MEKEFIGFVHYSPNTFNHVQWGNGTEKKSDYHPAKLDVPQWCRVCSRAGMKMMIFTAKHHDGFCQWNTKTTDFSSETILGGEDVMEAYRRAVRTMRWAWEYIFLHGICIKGEKGCGQSRV